MLWFILSVVMLVFLQYEDIMFEVNIIPLYQTVAGGILHA